MQQHPQPVHGDQPAVFGTLEHRRFQRLVHDVDDGCPGRERVDGQGARKRSRVRALFERRAGRLHQKRCRFEMHQCIIERRRFQFALDVAPQRAHQGPTLLRPSA